ncbi:MAG: DNA glycosylase [Clostridia bacterium]
METIIENISDFDLQQTLECGQCFRWSRDGQGIYTGVACGMVLRARQEGSTLILKGVGEKDDTGSWIDYFDLGTDYAHIKETLSRDNVLNRAIRRFPGIRILRQELVETTLSFILSTNNNIPRIKGNIEGLCKRFGKEVSFDGKTYHAFPEVERIAQSTCEEVSLCKGGYRCAYILETSGMMSKRPITRESMAAMGYEKARSTLKTFRGVGDKAAECILLFSCGYLNAFPVDVWIKRIMEAYYIKKSVSSAYVARYGQEIFGPLAGYAQQLLFSYARENKTGVG